MSYYSDDFKTDCSSLQLPTYQFEHNLRKLILLNLMQRYKYIFWTNSALISLESIIWFIKKSINENLFYIINCTNDSDG